MANGTFSKEIEGAGELRIAEGSPLTYSGRFSKEVSKEGH